MLEIPDKLLAKIEKITIYENNVFEFLYSFLFVSIPCHIAYFASKASSDEDISASQVTMYCTYHKYIHLMKNEKSKHICLRINLNSCINTCRQEIHQFELIIFLSIFRDHDE